MVKRRSQKTWRTGNELAVETMAEYGWREREGEKEREGVGWNIGLAVFVERNIGWFSVSPS